MIKLLIVFVHNSLKIINTRGGRVSLPLTKHLMELEGDCSWSVSAGFRAAEGRRVVENFWRTTAVVSPVQTAVFRYGAIKSPRALAEARWGQGPVYTSLRHRGRASSGVRYYHRKVTGSVTNVLGNFHAPFPPNRFYRFRVAVVIIVLVVQYWLDRVNALANNNGFDCDSLRWLMLVYLEWSIGSGDSLLRREHGFPRLGPGIQSWTSVNFSLCWFFVSLNNLDVSINHEDFDFELSKF